MNRLEQAHAEIGRRRGVAEAATPGPWCRDGRNVRLVRSAVDSTPTSGSSLTADAAHVEANDPAHVLAVLAAADATLDRHAAAPYRFAPDTSYCRVCWTPEGDDDPWPCPDAAAVLDLYAPEVSCA